MTQLKFLTRISIRLSQCSLIRAREVESTNCLIILELFSYFVFCSHTHTHKHPAYPTWLQWIVNSSRDIGLPEKPASVTASLFSLPYHYPSSAPLTLLFLWIFPHSKLPQPNTLPPIKIHSHTPLSTGTRSAEQWWTTNSDPKQDDIRTQRA